MEGPIHCTSCGHDNREEPKFCGDCGAALTRMCPSCGTTLRAGGRFCDGYGQPVSGSTTASPVRDLRAYTPRHLAEKILTTRAALEGERKQVTVLFADVKGSMELAEQLDPEEWHGIMDRFFQLLAVTSRSFTNTRMISMFAAIARGLRSTLDSMATPCSVKAYGRYRRPPRDFEVTDCDLKRVASSGVSPKRKSAGKRPEFRLTLGRAPSFGPRTASRARRRATPCGLSRPRSIARCARQGPRDPNLTRGCPCRQMAACLRPE